MPRNIEGRNPVLESLRSDTKILQIYLDETIIDDKRISEIKKLANKKGISIINKPDLKSVTKTNRHQGVIAIAKIKEQKKIKSIVESIYEKNETPLIIILSGTIFEFNLGSILRSAECAGAHAVLVSKKSLGLTPLVVKSSVGASEHIPLIQDDLHLSLKILIKQGLKIVALKEGTNKSIYNAKLNCPLAIVVGSEDSGINESLNKFIDEYISIPLKGKIESLNMAVATSICMFEAIRQRKL